MTSAKGSGVEHYSTFGKKYCSRCNGKGYTEHEGSLEDLELAQAIKWQTTQDSIIKTLPKNLLEYWLEKYREQKGGKMLSPKNVKFLRIICDKCNGTGKIGRNDGSGLGVVEDDCPNCGGDGCIEVEGTLEDLELAQAVRAWFNQKNWYSSFASDHGMAHKCKRSISELVDWYRKQKGGNE